MPNTIPKSAREVLLSVQKLVPWALTFHQELVHWPLAEKAFLRLIANGCDPHDLLDCLEFACSSEQSRYAKEKREISENVAVFAQQLLGTSKKLQLLEKSQKKAETLKTLRLPDFRGLSARLQVYAECLLDEAKNLTKGVSSREAPGLATAWLAARVEGSTGHPDYAAIARVMMAYYSMRGVHKDITNQAVSKQVERFRGKHSYAYRHMKNMARRQFGDLKEQYVSGRASK